MGTRFHQLGIQTFNAGIPGPSPTTRDRDKFVNPEITSKKISERAIGIELVSQCNGFHIRGTSLTGLLVDEDHQVRARGRWDERAACPAHPFS